MIIRYCTATSIGGSRQRNYIDIFFDNVNVKCQNK